MRPIGTLSQKIHCQAIPVVSAPPTIGPIATARPAIPPHAPRIAPRFSGGVSSARIVSVSGVTIAAPRPWMRAGDDQHLGAGRERGDHGGDGEDRQADDEQQLAPEAVAERGAREQEHGKGQRVGVHDPLELRQRRAQVLLDLRQGRHDDEVVQRGHEERDRRDRECPGQLALHRCYPLVVGMAKLRTKAADRTHTARPVTPSRRASRALPSSPGRLCAASAFAISSGVWARIAPVNCRVRATRVGPLRRADDLLDLRVHDLLAHLLEQDVDRVGHLADERGDDRVDGLLVDRGVGLEAQPPAQLLDVAVERRQVGHQLVVGDDHPERAARRGPRAGRAGRGRSACSWPARASCARCSPSAASSSTSSAPKRRLASTTRRSCSCCSRSCVRAPVGLGLAHLVLEARVAVPEERGGEGERGARVAADHERPHDLAGVVVRADDRRHDGRDEREDQQLQRPRAVEARVPVLPRRASSVAAIGAESSEPSTQRILSGIRLRRDEARVAAARTASASSIASSGCSARPAPHSAVKRSSPRLDLQRAG